MPEAQQRLLEYYASCSLTLILGDSDKLKQVFINLIRNACEAVEAGETIRWTVMEGSMKHICISVQNGGNPFLQMFYLD
ncbi:hypothetical protein [Leptolyngbya sp. FACHB-17]|uniref:hypothetical protein n=1 Tax=unclassified Leptolyngbya TaxID=2650499 RepID=UPI001680E9C3|nr:hypothetical protein [Leptolyngbya sp. FACHB-17]MBD2080196.1 hypothetical protein [Leptolyngbya sp. FACHB-17]